MSDFVSEVSIEHITPAQTLDLRSRILRPGQSIDTCYYAEDNFNTTIHLGAYIFNSDGERTLAANGTFMQNPHESFPSALNPYRLRGMATDEHFRHKGFGSQILKHAEMLLKTRRCDLLWFNARVSAFTFYEKNGYTLTGEMFDILGAGPHKVMYKWL